MRWAMHFTLTPCTALRSISQVQYIICTIGMHSMHPSSLKPKTTDWILQEMLKSCISGFCACTSSTVLSALVDTLFTQDHPRRCTNPSPSATLPSNSKPPNLLFHCTVEWWSALPSHHHNQTHTLLSRLPCYVFVLGCRHTNRNPNMNKLSWAINYTLLCFSGDCMHYFTIQINT